MQYHQSKFIDISQSLTESGRLEMMTCSLYRERDDHHPDGSNNMLLLASDITISHSRVYHTIEDCCLTKQAIAHLDEKRNPSSKEQPAVQVAQQTKAQRRIHSMQKIISFSTLISHFKLKYDLR